MSTKSGYEWVKGVIDELDSSADPARWPSGVKRLPDVHLLTAIDRKATKTLAQLRGDVPGSLLAAGEVQAVWFEMFLERIFDLSAEVRQPSGKYGPRLEMNLRFVSEACKLARVHLSRLAQARGVAISAVHSADEVPEVAAHLFPAAEEDF